MSRLRGFAIVPQFSVLFWLEVDLPYTHRLQIGMSIRSRGLLLRKTQRVRW